MAETDFELGLQHVAEELENLSDAISLEKKYFDEELGNTIKAGFVEAINKLIESESGKQFYDKELGSALKNLVGKIGSLKLDLSPLTNVFTQIMDQNQKILNAILSAPKPETNDSKYQEIILMQQKNYELLQKSLIKEAPVVKLEKKKQIEFVVTERDEFTQRLTRGLFIEK